MIISLLWDADYPWDVRVEKVVGSLLRDGHQVHLICRNLQRRAEYEYINGLHVHRLPRFPRQLTALHAVLSFPAFFNPLWLHALWKVSRRNRAELMMVRDLPMCPAGLWVARLLRIPCLMDMAECYPEMLRCTWAFEGVKAKNILVRNPRLADMVEKYCLRRLDMIMVMIEESAARLRRKGVPAARLAIVSNTPRLALAEQYLQARRESRQFDIVYIGLLNPSRGLDTVLEGAALLVKNGFAFRLTIAGTGKDQKRLQGMVKKLKLASHVIMPGWIVHEKVDELFSRATVGLVPHHVCAHWDHTIPNKLFDYMAAGIPVLSTNVRPMERIIRETECGLVYADWHPESFADAVMRLNDEGLRRRLGANGCQAVRARYHWETEEKVLLRIVQSTVQKK